MKSKPNSKVYDEAVISSKKAHKVQIANKLIDTMMNLEQNLELNQRRWIWELLQNAKDVCYNNVIKVKIDLKPDALEFSHTGKPFRTEDLVFLIEQTSSKHREDKDMEDEKYENEEEEKKININNTGKFGTGFITTHLLSRKVKIKGIWQGNEGKQNVFKNFELMLDRSGNSQKEMMKQIEKSFKVFQQIDLEAAYSEFKIGEKYSTKFIYELDERGREVAMRGIDDLKNSVLLTMLFNKQISSIRVRDRLRKTSVKYGFKEFIKYGEEKASSQLNIQKRVSESDGEQEGGNMTFGMEIFEIKEKGKEKLSKHYLAIKNDRYDLQTVFELTKHESNDSYYITPKDPISPIIYADFPLIGSEQIPYPCYFNSHMFKPNEPRSNLIMKGNLEEVSTNKALLLYLKEQTRQLMKLVCQNDKISNRHLMAITKTPKDFDEEWYKKYIQRKLRRTLYDLPIVYNNLNEYIKLHECMIPTADIKYVLDLYDLISPIFNEKMINKDLNYIEFWLNEFDKDWEITLNVKNLFDIYNLLDFIDGKKEVNELVKRLSFDDESEVFAWLNKIYTYMHDTIPQNECDKLLNKYSVIPNQLGILVKLDELIEDEGIPDPLKDVLFMFGQDIRAKLIDKNIFIEAKERMDLNCVIQNIEKYFDDPEINEDMKQFASIDILSIIPKKTEKNTELIFFREKFLEITKAFFESCIEKKQIDDINFLLWDKAEQYILKEIIKKIEKSGNIVKLSQFINKDRAGVLKILNEFYDIVHERNWRNYIKDKKIFPSQTGELNYPKDLSTDRVDDDIKGNVNVENENYGMNDMRNDMNLKSEESTAKISNEIKQIYKRLINEEFMESKLLDKAIYLKDYRIIQKELHLKDLCEKIEKVLQDRRAFISGDQVLRKIVKDIYNIYRLCKPEVRMQSFKWFDLNVHSIMADTMNDDVMKNIILDIALSESMEHDANIVKRMLNNTLSVNDIVYLTEKSKIQLPNNMNGTQSFMSNNNNILNNTMQLDEQMDVSFVSSPNELINFNITTQEQFKNLIQTKQIKIPTNFKPSQDAFEYVMKILERTKSNIFQFLCNSEEYDLSNAFFDEKAPNKNILMNVKKNNILINVVVRPADGNKIIIHNDREVDELDKPNNELWCGGNDGNVFQMTLGKIFRNNDLKFIKIMK